MLEHYLRCRPRVMWAIMIMCVTLMLSVYNLAVMGAIPLSRADYVTAARDTLLSSARGEVPQHRNRILQNTNDKDFNVKPSSMDIPSDMYHNPVGDIDNNIYLDDDEDAGGDTHLGVKPTSLHSLTTTLMPSNETRRLPDAIIIGVKKGGTRALLEFLRLHPNVRAPGPEPHFFDKNYHHGLDWYRSLMPPTMPGQMTIEKTPSYFVTKEVPKRIFDMSKNTKLLVVVRDPVVRAISDYTQTASKKPGMRSFEDMALSDHNTGLVNSSWGALRIGVYPKHLDRWLKHFPLSQFHFVNGERLIADPAGEMAKVQDFLGLDRLITDKHFYLSPDRMFPCMFKNEVQKKPHCLGKTKGRQHPDVDPYVIQRLRDFYKPFNLKFYQMVGQNFRWPS